MYVNTASVALNYAWPYNNIQNLYSLQDNTFCRNIPANEQPDFMEENNDGGISIAILIWESHIFPSMTFDILLNLLML